MDENRFKKLLTAYFNNHITRTDAQDLLSYLETADEDFVNRVTDEILTDKTTITKFDPSQQQQVFQHISQLVKLNEQRRHASKISLWHSKFKLLNLSIAAAALVALVSAIIFMFSEQGFNHSHKNDIAQIDQQSKADILLPDSNQAMLTLADGRVIYLNDSLSGELAKESGVTIRKQADGGILYDAQHALAAKTAEQYNTIRTPKGSTYQLLLPDGTKVWLNTASSIRFPVAFSGHERAITLTGEAYLEVAHDPKRTFNVYANGSTVRVFGTSFNVSAYQNDPKVTTTLMEGAVQVLNDHQVMKLQPGEQAVIDAEGQIHRSQANIRNVLAWKEGYFRFDNEDIKSVLNQISQWYNIDSIEYTGQLADRFSGTFKRTKSVSRLLSYLEKLAPVKFEIKERRIVAQTQ